ncbi:MAG: helix-turn-helix domain-containing protein [Candidatus Tectomicrobia bacterium]|uniref:Helix-turn-helix domain-containing protein n=1 Tax=Tectimicrobiota bacterium TaxID=2528274 RepID=A0A932FUD4_UNCTE|nr:helix-turn-helix domain-containing protein [Candidatus Tectomicrobia bacterium]
MEKIGLISLLRRDRKLPETEAQRRARARELTKAGLPPASQATAPVTPSTPLPPVPPEPPADPPESAISVALTPPERPPCGAGEPLPDPQESVISLELSPEQTQALQVLPLLASRRDAHASPPAFELTELQDQRGVVFQFSLRTEAIPEMVSVQDLCQQLKVSRQLVMDLVRKGELRCYRIGSRYRFAVAEVRSYLDRTSSQ